MTLNEDNHSNRNITTATTTPSPTPPTPSPPAPLNSTNNTTTNPDMTDNASDDSSEMDQADPKKASSPTVNTTLNNSNSATSTPDPDTTPRTKDTKLSVHDHGRMIPQLLPETGDLETEDIQVFHWHIKDWKALEARSHGPVFRAGGFPWQILLFPKGNNQNENVSIYLEVADPANHGLPDDWHVCAQFSLVISHPEDPTNHFHNNATHRFSGEEIDWGFTRFYELKSLRSTHPTTQKGPFLVDNQAVISVYLRVVKDETGVLWHNFANYDSRKETGYVGIKNQGATCYMNSLLQSLYCTNSFRRAVYQIPTESDKPTDSVSLALQRCFYNLQFSDMPIGTTELTKSFGWDSLEAFMQHDVQEFNRVLQDRLEEKMKGTPADGAISKLFLGKMKSYIKCINVNYESSRVEDYYDIQLNVKGCKNLTESFKDYVTVETMEGENKYMAEGHGLQDAEKGVIFESFPPVLHLQLKRFEYDFMRDTMVKINDRHEFPPEINLDEFCSNKDPNDPNDYVLHGVLVHSGDLHGGHYFALIKPNKDGKWLRFDDDRVTPVTLKEVFDENFGDEPVKGNGNALFMNGRNNSMRMMRRFTNAYMLVYMRRSKLDEVLGAVEDSDIPPHLQKRHSEEQAAQERQKRDREEMRMHVKVAVVTDATFADRQEFDLAMFDDKNLETTPGVAVFKVAKTDKIASLRPMLQEHFKLPSEKFRLWSIVNRTNKTVRVDQPLTPTEEKQTVNKLRESVCAAPYGGAGFAKLYLELPTNTSTNFKFPHIKNDVSIVFLKYFDVFQQTMKGVGHVYIKSSDKVGEITPILLERAGLSKDTPLALYEEVKPSMIEHLNLKQTFHAAEIQNGDIICYQLALTEDKAKQINERGGHATVREYFASLYHQVEVEFKPKTDKRGEEVKLKLDRRIMYSSVARDLAKALPLECDPMRIRFTTAGLSKQPKDVLPYSPRLALENMVPGLWSAADYALAADRAQVPPGLIYYEVLDVSVADLETKKSLKVNVIYPTLRDETTVHALVPRTGIVRDLVASVCAKAKIDAAEPEHVRVFETSDGKISAEFSPDQSIDSVNDKSAHIYAEKIPEDELTMDQDNDRLIQVVHYHKDPARLHGVPFRFVAKQGELFAETKKRLQSRLGISDKEWAKVKFAIVRNLDAVEPEVQPIDKEDFVLRDAKLGESGVLGLDRVDKSSRASRFGSMFERGIFIRG